MRKTKIVCTIGPASDSEEIDGEVFIMKLVELDGEEMLEGIDDGELFDRVYNIFKENNKDEFEFLDWFL